MRREAETSWELLSNPGEGDGGLDSCLAVKVERSDITDLNQQVLDPKIAK